MKGLHAWEAVRPASYADNFTRALLYNKEGWLSIFRADLVYAVDKDHR